MTTPAPDLAILLEGVVKRFGDKTVLDGIDLEVQPGESLAIIGGSGTGKSVLLKHIIGLLRPDEGRVAIEGTDWATLRGPDRTEFRQRFGMAFQEGALFDSMTVAQNVGFALKRSGRFDRGEVQERVDECLALVRLEGQGDKLPSELSGGMRRRVGFARAIALRPRILLFDEPNTGLDPVLSATIDDLILQLQQELGSTAVTITHDLRSAFRIADRIVMLHHGQLIADATPEAFRELDDPRVRQFVEGRSDGPLNDPDFEA